MRIEDDDGSFTSATCHVVSRRAARRKKPHLFSSGYCCSDFKHGGRQSVAAIRERGELTFNKLRLGNDWFEQSISERVVELIIHEFGHNESLDHLSSEYHEALCRIGAKMFELGRRGEL